MAIANCRYSSATINNSNNFSEKKNNKPSLWTDSSLSRIYYYVSFNTNSHISLCSGNFHDIFP